MGAILALPLESYPLTSWGEANNRWIESTLELGHQAVCGAITDAGIRPDDIGAFFFVSVTGVCSPSIEGRLINKMHLNPNTKRIPIFGLGCVAGAAGIARAADYVKAYPKQAALLLSVELVLFDGAAGRSIRGESDQYRFVRRRRGGGGGSGQRLHRRCART